MARAGLSWHLVITGVLLAGVGCGGGDTSWLALRIHPADQATAWRRFPPASPEPLFVNVRVFRSDDPLGSPVANQDAEWAGMEKDPDSGQRFMRVAVPANDQREYEYLVRVSSVIDDGSGGALVDECGVAAHVVAPAGMQVPVELVTHLGDCSPLLCQVRADCVGVARYCLSFECYDGSICGQCPAGAGCDAAGKCSGDCGADDDCTNGFGCCRGTCSSHCPDW